jgi:hypothetical protein
MAEPVALGIKPPQAMSLGDMLNLARGAQAYQQAEQANPLSLQKAQMEIEQAQRMNPLAVTKSELEVRNAQSTARSNELKLGGEKRQAALEAGASLRSHPAVIEASKLKPDASEEEKQQQINKLIKLVNTDFVSRLEENDLTPLEIEHQRNGLIRQIMQSPQGFASHLERGTALAGGAQTLAGQNLPQIKKIGNIEYQFTPATGELKQIGAEATPKPTEGKGNELFKEDMPIPAGSVMQLNERQQARYNEGDKIQKDSINALDAANQMTQSIRKIRETINSAKGSLTGQALRNAIKAAVGDAEYETLNKNLEDLYVRNVAAMGGDTDAARASIKTTLGSPDITKEALDGIIDRVDSSTVALKKFNKGFNNYAKKTSTENALVHARQFQQAWNENSDPLVFMAQAMKESTKSQAEKDLFRQKMHKTITDEQAAELKKKSKAIDKLVEGDRFLGNK